MNEEGGKGADPHALITESRIALEKLQASRWAVRGLILGVVALFVVLFVCVISDFRRRKLPAFAAQLGNRMSLLSGKFSDDMSRMLQRVQPRYVAAFTRMFEEKGPEVKAQIEREMRKLDAFATQRRPQMREAVLALANAQAQVIRAEIEGIVGPAEAAQLEQACAAALTDRYEELVASTLSKHTEVAESIGASLDQMLETEPDIRKPVEPTRALGILLELAGLELQQGPRAP
ncbi:MAG: hypothetical protein JXR37_19960 [Kiritimatiellae bacterium]|nr:hypothetical protein [Kiritimatiellia bacterium]